MSDLAPVTPLFVGTTSAAYSALADLGTFASYSFPSATWVTANLAVYVPVYLPWPYPVRRVWWVNGTAAGGNLDFGIYTQDGTKVYSTGSTAGSGNTVPQFVSPTEFMLTPGAYYFALSVDNTTANRVSAITGSTVSQLRVVGVLQQGSAFALPATATFAAVTDAIYPLCGVTKTASGF